VKPKMWLAGTCLLGGLMAVALVGGLRTSARAAAVRLIPGGGLSLRPVTTTRAVVINEVAWMGTDADAYHEWIELYNTTGREIDLRDWALSDHDGTLATLTGTVPAGGTYLLARDAETFTGTDSLIDQLFSGNLRNAGEAITLTDATGRVIDTANTERGYDNGWAAGSSSSPSRRTMERVDYRAADADANWADNDGITRNGFDADGASINGTPRCRNSAASDAANLAVEKIAPAYVGAGERISYAIRLRNAGNIAATAVRLTDTLPAGITLYTHTAPYVFTFTQPASGTLVWEVGILPVSTTLATFTVLADARGDVSGVVTNVVTATTAVTEAAPGNDVARTATAVLRPEPDLGVAKSGPVSVTAGALITYHIVLSNTGQTPAVGVVVSDVLPAGVSYGAESHPPDFTLTESGSTVVWTATTVVTGTTYTFTIDGQVADIASGPLTNRVTATTASGETQTANNIATLTTMAIVNWGPLDVVINEVAWMGTSDTSDEWIELASNADREVNLDGWTLVAADGTPAIHLTGTITARGYYLLERGDDDTVSDIAADQIYKGALSNDPAGEVLTLRDSRGDRIDTANDENGGSWPAGDNATKRTMERVDPLAADTDANWCDNDPSIARNGEDVNGVPINGTPKAQNSCYQPSPISVADLDIAKIGPHTILPGSPITYRITLSNNGSITATAVLVTDTLPPAVDFVNQTSAFTFTRLGRELVWQIGDVSAGDHHLITFTGRVAGTAAFSFSNYVTVTTTASEMITANNTAAWATAIGVSGTPRVRITALHYYGYDSINDETVRLVNLGDATADLSGWYLNDEPGDATGATFPNGASLAPGAGIWCARSAVAFAGEFGFRPDYETEDTDPSVPELTGSWPGFSNDGDECALFEGDTQLVDVLVYGDSTSQVGWSGAAVQPWTPTNAFAKTGQIIYRKLDQVTGSPVPDTNTADDWAHDSNDHVNGRKVLYPGWDLDEFFQTAKVTETASLTVAVAPDNAYEVIKSHLESASTSILIEAYTFENAHLIDTVVSRAQAGVTVRVLLEGEEIRDQERWFCQRLHAAGGEAYFFHNDDQANIHDRYSNQHAKFMVLDGRILIVGSENFNYSALPADDKSNGTWGRRGAFLVTDAPGVVARAQAIFDRDLDTAHKDIVPWDPDHPRYGEPTPGFAATYITSDWVSYTVTFGQPLVLTDTTFAFEVVQSPENSLRDVDGLLGLVKRAGPGDTVLVQQLYEQEHWGPADSTPTADPNPRLEAYIAAARRGASVRILLNGSLDAGPVAENVTTRAYVNGIAWSEGLDLEAQLGDPLGRGVHNKMVLVWLEGEGGYAHVGSINGSEVSSKVNRELALQVRSEETYRYLARVFKTDWWLAHPVFLPLVMRSYAPPAPPVGYVVISEVMYRPGAQSTGNREWVELFNPTSQPVDISNWQLGDAAAPGEYGAGIYRFPDGTVLSVGGVIVVAQQADDFQSVSGLDRPHFEFLIDPGRDNLAVPNMIPDGTWNGFGFVLGDAGDKVILRDVGGADVDVVVYGAAGYPGVTPHSGGVDYNWSLERRPPYYDTDDCSADFLPRYPATPGSVPLP